MNIGAGDGRHVPSSKALNLLLLSVILNVVFLRRGIHADLDLSKTKRTSGETTVWTVQSSSCGRSETTVDGERVLPLKTTQHSPRRQHGCLLWPHLKCEGQTKRDGQGSEHINCPSMFLRIFPTCDQRRHIIHHVLCLTCTQISTGSSVTGLQQKVQ